MREFNCFSTQRRNSVSKLRQKKAMKPRSVGKPSVYEYYTHTQLVNSPLFRNIPVSQYQKGETNLNFTKAKDSEWQWHQLGDMQVCISLQTDNHASTPPLSFLQAG